MHQLNSKYFEKFQQKTEKNSTILFQSTQYTNSRRSLRNSITQVMREREFIAQWQQNKNKASDYAWRAVKHASPRTSQKAQFIKSL